MREIAEYKAGSWLDWEWHLKHCWFDATDALLCKVLVSQYV